MHLSQISQYLSPWIALPAILLLPFLRPLIVALLHLVFQPFASGLKDVPGPYCNNFFWGHLKQFVDTRGGQLQQEWIRAYGNVFVYRTLFGVCNSLNRSYSYIVDLKFIQGYRLCVSDARAITHVLSHADIYPKPNQHRIALGRILGQGGKFHRTGCRLRTSH